MNNDRLFIKEGNRLNEVKINNSKDIEVTFEVPSPESIGLALSDVSEHIDILDTPLNQQMLGYISEPNSFDEKGIRSNLIESQLHTSQEIIKGFLKIESSSNSKAGTSHKALFKTGNVGWSDIAKETYINQLDLGNEEYSEARVSSLIADDSAYNYQDKVWYSLKDYGGLNNVFGLDSDTTTPILPDVYAKALIEAFEKKTGYTIECPFFESEYFRRITHPSTAKLNNIIIHADVLESLSPVLSLSDQTFGNSLTAILFNVVSGGSSVQSINGYTEYISLVDTQYLIKVEYETTPINATMNLGVYIDGVLSDIIQMTSVDDIRYITVSMSKNSALSFKTLEGTIHDMTISAFRIKPEFPLSPDVIFNVASVLPSETFADYLKGLIHLFGLMIVTKKDSNKIIIAPYSSTTLPTGEYIKGFYLKNHLSEDWTNKVLDNYQVEYNDKSKRFLKFLFKKDSDDNFFGDNEVPFSETIDLGVGDSDTRTISNTIFRPTGTSSKGHIMPVFEGKNDGENYAFGLRILYKIGNVTGSYDWLQTGNTLQSYPISMQVSALHGVNLGFESEENTKSLIEIFYADRIETMKDKTTWIFDAYLENGVDKIDRIRKKKYIDGQLYILYKIERLNISQSKSLARCYFRKSS